MLGRERVLLCPTTDQAKSRQAHAEQGHGGRLRNGNAFSTAATAASEDHLVAAAVCEAAEAHLERCRPATASGAG